MIPNENGHFGHLTHTIFLYFFAIFPDSIGQIFLKFLKHFSLKLIGLALLFSLFPKNSRRAKLTLSPSARHHPHVHFPPLLASVINRNSRDDEG